MTQRYLETFKVVAQNEVNNTCNCVRTVGRRCTLFEDLDSLKRRHGNSRCVNKDRTVVSDSRRDCLTLAVNKNQCRRETRPRKLTFEVPCVEPAVKLSGLFSVPELTASF